jgi:hypothetical protein
MTKTTRALGITLLLSALPGLPVSANAQYVPWNPIPGGTCSGYSTTVIPVGIAQIGGGRYLSYGGAPGTRIIPIGVSPDNGAALYLNDTSVISQTIAWQTVLANLATSGLNRLRVWVAFGSANDSRNTPFTYHTDAMSCPTGLNPCFRLDQKNQPFFDRLRSVVNEARSHQMFVEVTFFSPFWGDNAGSTFANGPWGGRGAYFDGVTIRPIQLTSANNFVLDAQSGDNLTMQTQFQANVIKWTVDELWCFDNIWYEIANEPEAPNLVAARTANWEKSLIANDVVPEDSTANFPFLQRPHLIAVNVFSTGTTADFLGAGNPNVSIVNGHYTEVVNTNNDSGALIYLADGNLGAGKVLGFNETKITTTGVTGNAYTRSLTNDTTVQYGGPEAGRSEAWEFMLTRGGTVDHFGYLSGGSPGTVGPIASQMSKLQTFMLSLPIGQLVASPDPASVPAPAWVSIGHHPDPQHGVFPTWNAARHSYKYWGALQTPDGTASPNRVFVLYLHNSAPRCKESGDTVNYDPTGQCSTHGYIPLNSYDARIWTTTKYQESNLALNLGATPGTFRVCWYDPAGLTLLSSQTCTWNGTSCSAAVSSPTYPYDILLRIEEKPLPCP